MLAQPSLAAAFQALDPDNKGLGKHDLMRMFKSGPTPMSPGQATRAFRGLASLAEPGGASGRGVEDEGRRVTLGAFSSWATSQTKTANDNELAVRRASEQLIRSLAALEHAKRQKGTPVSLTTQGTLRDTQRYLLQALQNAMS